MNLTLLLTLGLILGVNLNINCMGGEAKAEEGDDLAALTATTGTGGIALAAPNPMEHSASWALEEPAPYIPLSRAERDALYDRVQREVDDSMPKVFDGDGRHVERPTKNQQTTRSHTIKTHQKTHFGPGLGHTVALLLDRGLQNK